MVKAVKKLQAAGGKFVLSTGRAWSAINRKGQLGGIRFDYAITCNGACVVDKNGTIVAEHPMTNEEMYALVDFCEDYNYPLQFDFKDAYYAYCEYDILHKYYDQMNSVGLDCVDGEDQDRHLIDMPHAAFCIFPEGALERFNEKYGHLGLHFMQTGGQLPDGSHFYDIVRGGIDKGAGPRRPLRKDGPLPRRGRGGRRLRQRCRDAESSRPRLLHVQRHRRSQSRR